MRSWSSYRPDLKVIDLISKIERFQGNWEKNKRLSPAIVDTLVQTTIVTSSGASTRIEGALLSDAEVQQFVSNGIHITALSSRSEREVAGYIKALEYIYENDEVLDVSERTIRELHQLLTSELSEDSLPSKQRGYYKDVPNDVIEKNMSTGEEKVWIRTTPPGIQTETEMRDLLSQYKAAADDKLPALIRISIFIVRFLAIHPFRDGNGRLSRLLTCLLLLKEYKWSRFVSHEKFIEDNKEAYYASLRTTQNTFKLEIENYDAWVIFFTTIIFRQTAYLDQLLKNLNTGDAPGSLNSNEAKVYKFLEKNGQSRGVEINKVVKLSKDGFKKLMKRLVARSIIEKIGAGPSTEYRIL